MKELIERVYEIYNNLRLCIAVKEEYGCRLCPYYEHGCRYTPILDAAEIIKRTFKEIGHG